MNKKFTLRDDIPGAINGKWIILPLRDDRQRIKREVKKQLIENLPRPIYRSE